MATISVSHIASLLHACELSDEKPESVETAARKHFGALCDTTPLALLRKEKRMITQKAQSEIYSRFSLKHGGFPLSLRF